MQENLTSSLYTAKVMHPDKVTRDKHEQMGFFDGWNTVITQLDDFAILLS